MFSSCLRSNSIFYFENRRKSELQDWTWILHISPVFKGNLKTEPLENRWKCVQLSSGSEFCFPLKLRWFLTSIHPSIHPSICKFLFTVFYLGPKGTKRRWSFQIKAEIHQALPSLFSLLAELFTGKLQIKG